MVVGGAQAPGLGGGGGKAAPGAQQDRLPAAHGLPISMLSCGGLTLRRWGACAGP